MPAKKKRNDPKLAKLYAEVKRNFTAEDLVKYTEITPTFPLKDLIAELETKLEKYNVGTTSKKSRAKPQNGTKGRKKSA